MISFVFLYELLMRQAVAQGQPSKKEDMGTRSITKIACVWKRDAHVNSRWCSTHARHVSTQQAIFVLACSCCSTISERKQRLLVVYKRPEKGQENTCSHISSRVKIRHIQVNICKKSFSLLHCKICLKRVMNTESLVFLRETRRELEWKVLDLISTCTSV